MNKVRSLIAKLFPAKETEARNDSVLDPLSDTDIETQFRRLVVHDNYWRGADLDVQDGYTFSEAVYISMRNFKSYPEQLRVKIVNHQFKSVTGWVLQGWTEAKFNEFFAYREELGGTAIDDSNSLLSGLRSYKQLPQVEDFTTTDEQTQEKVRALLSVARTLPRKYVGIYASYDDPRDEIRIIDNEDLLQLVLDKPHMSDQIISVITERKTSDVAVIKAVLGAEAPPLCNGVL